MAKCSKLASAALLHQNVDVAPDHHLIWVHENKILARNVEQQDPPFWQPQLGFGMSYIDRVRLKPYINFNSVKGMGKTAPSPSSNEVCEIKT